MYQDGVIWVGCALILPALTAALGSAPIASAAWVGFTPTGQPTSSSEPTIPPPEPTVPPEPTPLPTPVPAPPYETPRPKPGGPELPEKRPVPPPLPSLPTVEADAQPAALPITGLRARAVRGLAPDKLAVRLIVSWLTARGLFDPSQLIFVPAAGLPEPGVPAVGPVPLHSAARSLPPVQLPRNLPQPQASNNLVVNGNFEGGFEFGVARGWNTFASPDGVEAAGRGLNTLAVIRRFGPRPKGSLEIFWVYQVRHCLFMAVREVKDHRPVLLPVSLCQKSRYAQCQRWLLVWLESG